jgi:WD40 repeat protein
MMNFFRQIIGSRLRPSPLDSHLRQISCIDFNERCEIAITGSGDGTLAIWDAARVRCKRTLQGHQSYVRSVGINPTGNLAVSVAMAGDDLGYSKDAINVARLWDITSGTCIGKLPNTPLAAGDINSFNFTLYRPDRNPVFTPDSRVVIIAKSYAEFAAWDVATQLNLYVKLLGNHYLDKLQKQLITIGFSGREREDDLPIAVGASGGQSYLIAGTTGSLRLFRFRNTSEWIADATEILQSDAFKAYMLTKTAALLTGQSLPYINHWQLPFDEWDGVNSEGTSLYSVAFSGDGKVAASAAYDYIRVWKLRDEPLERKTVPWLRPMQTIKTKGLTRSVALSVDGKLAASEDSDGTRALWNVASGHCIRRVEGKIDPIRMRHIKFLYSLAIRFTPDSRRLFFSSRKHPMESWDLASIVV